MENLLLVRHGQTFLNAKHRLQGWFDAPLTPRGQEQTAKLSQQLQTVPLTQVYTSDLQRAVATTKILLKNREDNVPVTKWPLLREYYFGSQEGQAEWTTFQHMRRHFGWSQIQAMWQASTGFPKLIHGFASLDQSYQAESYSQFKNRGQQILAQLADDTGQGNTLIVAHSLLLSMLVYLVDPQKLPNQLLGNSQVTILRRNATGFIVAGVNLETSAEITHCLETPLYKLLA